MVGIDKPETEEEYNELSERGKSMFCIEHGVQKVKGAFSHYVCPFCEIEEWEGDEDG